ncbi:MAG: molybdate ABC transporter substrate-binding protein [Candidatus Promineifilaceae bacterium]
MQKVKRFLPIAWLLVAGGLAGCSAPAERQVIVFAAASLAEAFAELARGFEADHPGVAVVLNLAGSQQLAQQLSQGAPADVFASANQHQLEAAVQSGRVPAGAARPFAGNRLVVVYPAANPAGVVALGDLAQPGLKLVLAAAEVPAGTYAQAFLEQAAADPALGMAFRQAVLDNVVSYEENVRAVLSKVELGEADAGIVYSSDAQAAGAAVGRLAIPEALQSPAVYPIAAVSDAPEPALAADFIAFVLSPAGQAILEAHGFLPAVEAQPG